MKIDLTLQSVFILFSFLQLSAQQCYDTVYSGEATYYGGIAGSSGGNCSLPVAEGDYFHCAMNTIEYDNSNACGACITVNGTKGSITLQVVDRCPECASGDVDMTQEAFSQIANVIDGRVPITWKYTSCTKNLDRNVQIVFKEGSSEFWTGIQFRNTTHAIISMEYKDSNGNWISVPRELYNFFIAPNGISSPMVLRTTSVLGEKLIFENVTLVNSEIINTDQQFSNYQNCLDKSEEDILSIENFNSSSYSITTTDNFIIADIVNNNFINPDRIHLYNLSGQKINIKTTSESKNLFKLDIQHLATGIYVLKIEDNKKNIISQKIVIK